MHGRGCLLLAALTCAASLAHAGSTGKIAGLVKDSQTGEALIGANVVIEGTTQGAATNIDGYYAILNVEPGTYALVVSAVGYNRTRINEVRVSIDLTTTINVNLVSMVVDVGEEVVVTAERPMVRQDLTAKTAVVGGDQIAALPVVEVQEVLNLQAGFVAGSLRGGRSGEVAYWIDGVPVTDAFNGSQVVEINKSLVQELQLVSGAYNAEYGQAMSGIVNIATREGGQKFAGGLTLYGGQYAVDDAELFPGLDGLHPTRIRNIDANLSGPIVGDDLTFFANGRYIYFDGWLKGFRRFNPWNISYTDDLTREFTLYRDPDGKGDSSAVSMNPSERWYGQGKLAWKILSTLKLTGNYIYDRTDSKGYNRFYYYNPDGLGTNIGQSHTFIFQLTHTLSQNTFYTLGGSWFQRNLSYELYDLEYAAANDGSGDLIEVSAPGSPHYTHPKLLLTDDPYSFATGGTDLAKFKRATTTKLLKLDLSSQFDQFNLVKVGAEVRLHNVFYENIQLQPIASQTDIDLAIASPFIQTRILPTSSNVHDVYDRRPREYSAYIQDKVEFNNFILNIGVRYDYFEPDGFVLNDDLSNNGEFYTVDDPDIYAPIKPSNRARTLEERLQYWYRPASPKHYISPRLGASFPITDRGMVYFSYGHFIQIPRFEYLYQNPEFKIGFGTGNQGVVGNADLQPELTINAEIGVRQQLTDDIAIDVTAYLRDIRNLTGTRSDEIVVFGGSSKYSKYVNSDFGFVRGIVLTLSKRFGGGFAATVDYTFQVAEGSASDPQEARNAVAGGSLPEVQLLPLGWDQRHTLNLTANYSVEHWGLSAIYRYGSGTPYTPRRLEDVTSLLTNSQSKPATNTLDMRAFYQFGFGELRLIAFARVFNLLDTRNEVTVFDDTGRAGFTTDEERARLTNPQERVNTLDQWFTQPTNFSEPRRIEFGLTLEF
jgi:outer membrane receptor protein involved in Fe transport